MWKLCFKSRELNVNRSAIVGFLLSLGCAAPPADSTMNSSVEGLDLPAEAYGLFLTTSVYSSVDGVLPVVSLSMGEVPDPCADFESRYDRVATAGSAEEAYAARIDGVALNQWTVALITSVQTGTEGEWMPDNRDTAYKSTSAMRRTAPYPSTFAEAQQAQPWEGADVWAADSTTWEELEGAKDGAPLTFRVKLADWRLNSASGWTPHEGEVTVEGTVQPCAAAQASAPATP